MCSAIVPCPVRSVPLDHGTHQHWNHRSRRLGPRTSRQVTQQTRSCQQCAVALGPEVAHAAFSKNTCQGTSSTDEVWAVSLLALWILTWLDIGWGSPLNVVSSRHHFFLFLPFLFQMFFLGKGHHLTRIIVRLGMHMHLAVARELQHLVFTHLLRKSCTNEVISRSELMTPLCIQRTCRRGIW